MRGAGALPLARALLAAKAPLGPGGLDLNNNRISEADLNDLGKLFQVGQSILFFLFLFVKMIASLCVVGLWQGSGSEAALASLDDNDASDACTPPPPPTPPIPLMFI